MGKSNKQKKRHFIYALLIFIATIFMGIGYAAINGVLLSIDGVASAISMGSLYITNVIYDTDNGANTVNSFVNGYSGTTLNSTIELGSLTSSTITYAVTIYNTTNDNYKYTGTSFDVPTFYDNTSITFDVTGINVGDNLLADSNITIYITFRYAGSDTSNPVLNSYISFNFEKYYAITYQHIDTTNKNYPSILLDSETSKSITFTDDVPFDVSISPNVSFSYTYNTTSGTLVLNNVKNNITIDRYYSITYNTAGTNAQNQPTKYLHGSIVTFLTPTNGNNTFDGWYRDAGYTGNPIVDTTGLNEDLVLYAKWSSSHYQNATDYIINITNGASNAVTDVITATTESTTCTNTLAYDNTTDKNLRYVGTNPCNYVKFNCDSSNNCELWRIIGVMNDAYSEPVLKIVKNDNSLSKRINNKNANSWVDSEMYSYLNNDYLNTLNANVINNYVLNAQWYIGKVAYNGTPTAVYSSEKGTLSTASYIGIINLSDYAYSTSGTNSSTRNTCITSGLTSTSITASCSDNSYLSVMDNNSNLQNQWTIDASNQGQSYVYIGTNSGRTARGNATSAYAYRPVLYLKSNVQIDAETGNGSAEEPYILYVNNN